MQRSFKISLSQEYYSEKVCLSQYDSDYAVNFEVLDKGAKAPINGMTAYFEGTRCDGLSFRYSGTASDNYVSFTIDTALTAVSGRHTGEIVLYDGSGLRFGSANVQILVEKAARPDNAIDVYAESPINTYYTEYVSPIEWSNDHSIGDSEWVDNDRVHPLSYGYLHGYVPLIKKALIATSSKGVTA